MIEPIIIQKGNRRAVINGNSVSLLRLRNKQTPTGVWKDTPVADPVKRMYVAHAWALKGVLDDDFVMM